MTKRWQARDLTVFLPSLLVLNANGCVPSRPRGSGLRAQGWARFEAGVERRGPPDSRSANPRIPNPESRSDPRFPSLATNLSTELYMERPAQKTRLRIAAVGDLHVA